MQYEEIAFNLFTSKYEFKGYLSVFIGVCERAFLARVLHYY